MPSPLRASCFDAACGVVAGGELIGGAKKRLPPGESPRTPLFLQPREPESDFSRFLVEHRRRGLLAAIRGDHWTRKTMMCGDQVKDQIALVLGKVADARFAFDTKTRSSYVQVPV